MTSSDQDLDLFSFAETQEKDKRVDEMRSLIKRLNDAADAYYNGLPEQMTDFEWDAAFDELKKLESETGTVLPDSPTSNVSADDIAGQKEEHEFPALSLAKTKLIPEVAKWAEGLPIWLSWKLDGLTLVVTWDDGKLTKVVTRGNGHIGTNITHLAPSISGIPATVPLKGHLVVRGEAVISYADFEQFLVESEEDYANPRNLASGSLTLKDPAEVARRRIRWIPFTLVHADEEPDTWGERMDALEKAGLRPVERERIETPDISTLTAAIERWTKKVTDKVNPYPVDGLVVAYDDALYAATGSVTGHHATRAGLAFKWADEAAETVLEKVEWSCAASTISPVAVFAPVELEGTTVKRASLCNITECERLGIGAAGTRIAVIKANKIIPKVIRVDETAGTFEIPSVCPVCGKPTEVLVSADGATKKLRCTNAACTAKQLKKFARFVSKEGMDIDGISEQTLARFINLGWIRSYPDLYRLADHAEEMAQLDGFGGATYGKGKKAEGLPKSVTNILAAIEKSREGNGRRFLFALTIPLCGVDVAKRLLQRYPLDEVIKLASETEDEAIFADIDGIGEVRSASFVQWFHDAANRETVRRLLEEVRFADEAPSATGDKCVGLTFVITGDVHHFKNRAELKGYIESEGGKVVGSVSGSTSFLINNDVESTSGKNQKAKKLSIPILSEDDFLAKFGPDAD